jgi:hypothetical protein
MARYRIAAHWMMAQQSLRFGNREMFERILCAGKAAIHFLLCA